MSRRHEIIGELEEELGVECDPNFDAGVNEPCDGDGCRHAECDCWYSFECTVRKHLEEQARDLEFLATLDARMDYLSLVEGVTL